MNIPNINGIYREKRVIEIYQQNTGKSDSDYNRTLSLCRQV